MKTTQKLGLPVILAHLGLMAQVQTQAASTSVPDSVVQIVAESANLQEIPYANLPAHGSTYWEILPGGLEAPLPEPLFDPSLPIYQITPTIFVVDSTFGEILVNPRQSAGLSPTAARTAAVNAEATKVSNLIALVQSVSAQTTAPHTLALASSATTSSATLLAASATAGGTLSPAGQQQPQSGVPYLTIASSGTNQLLITVFDNNGPQNFEIWYTPVLANASYPWTAVAAGNTGVTNFVINTSSYYAGFFRAYQDTNSIPLWEAANPANPGAGVLAVFIDSPTNGAVLQ